MDFIQNPDTGKLIKEENASLQWKDKLRLQKDKDWTSQHQQQQN